jgi:hypothetical protein
LAGSVKTGGDDSGGPLKPPKTVAKVPPLGDARKLFLACLSF